VALCSAVILTSGRHILWGIYSSPRETELLQYRYIRSGGILCGSLEWNDTEEIYELGKTDSNKGVLDSNLDDGRRMR
jgi:hypothetical protein